MLVTAKELMAEAMKGRYAIGAFNVENMEMVMAVLAAAEAQASPVIMQTTPATIRYAGVDYYYANVATAAARSRIPVVMHLDHGDSFACAMSAYRAGYTSIMIDGSKLPLEENIALTRRVAEACHPGGVSVEGELGRVGGKEDDLEGGEDNPFTDPAEAKQFVEETGVDCLAVGVGTAHGVYKGIPRVNTELIAVIRDLVQIPLVLHGTSGVPDEQVRTAVRNGICKVNYATDLRIAFTNGVREFLTENPEAFDPKLFCRRGMAGVQSYVEQKMIVCGSAGKA